MRHLSYLLVLSSAVHVCAANISPLLPTDPAWIDLAAAFTQNPDSTAAFTEKRFFPFRKTPLELSGVSRVSTAHGLSLDYQTPEQRTVVLDGLGMLVRQTDGDSAAPTDPRASAVNLALVDVLRFDLSALATRFELFGARNGEAWTLTLVPRTADLRRAVEEIVVAGEAAQVRHIVLRRSAKQYVEISVGASRTTPFTAEDLKTFFR